MGFNKLKYNPSYSPYIDWSIDKVFAPMGNVFFQSLFMVIVPLIFSSLIVGIADMRNPASIGRLGKRLILFYACSTLIAIFIGQICMGVMKPGDHISKAEADKAAISMQERMSSIQEKSSMVGTSLWPGLLTKIVPRNIINQFAAGNILAVIFVSILFGLGLLYMPNGPPKESFISFMSAVSSVSIIIIKWIMKTAPFAVAALLAVVVYELGLSAIKTMMFYMLAMTVGMIFHLFGTYSLFLKFLLKIPIKEFFLRMIPVLGTAFGTSSSSATMPVTMNTLEKKFGLPKKIVSFSIPIGATVNMDGTALFEVAAAIFISQVYNIHLPWPSLVLLVILVFITSVGIAGVPGGSIPVLMSSIVVIGLPPEGIALILGVDRLMDMGRTTINVTGDSIAALFLGRTEGINLGEKLKEIPR